MMRLGIMEEIVLQVNRHVGRESTSYILLFVQRELPNENMTNSSGVFT